VLIPFEDYCEKITDEIFRRMHLSSDPRFSPRFRSFIRFSGTKAIPFILNIASFFVLYRIFTAVQANYGNDKLFVLVAVIFVMSLKLNGKK